MPTPTQVQKVIFGQGTGSTDTTDRSWPLPNAVLSGNTVIVVLNYADTAGTLTVTDDKSNTYTLLGSKDDTGNQIAAIYYHVNTTNAPTVIHIKFSSASGFLAGYVSEWYNISSTTTNFKVSAGNTGVSTTPSPGSITPANGDLVISYAVVDNINFIATTPNALTSWTKPTGFTLDKADIWGCDAVAYAISSGSATNASWTVAYNGTQNENWVSIQGSFTSASQGTAPSTTPRIVSTIHQNLDYGAAGSGGGATSPFNMQIPFSNGGTALYASINANLPPTTFTDSVNGAWTQTGASLSNGATPAGYCKGWYFLSASISQTMTATLAFSGTDPDNGSSNVFIHEIVGIGSFDKQTTNTGNSNTGTTTVAHAPDMTPSSSGGLIFVTLVSLDATSGIPNCYKAISPGIFIASVDLNEEVNNWINDNNNGWAFYANPNTSAINFTWTTGVVNTLNWAAIADAFEASGGDVLMGQGVM